MRPKGRSVNVIRVQVRVGLRLGAFIDGSKPGNVLFIEKGMQWHSQCGRSMKSESRALSRYQKLTGKKRSESCETHHLSYTWGGEQSQLESLRAWDHSSPPWPAPARTSDTSFKPPNRTHCQPEWGTRATIDTISSNKYATTVKIVTYRKKNHILTTAALWQRSRPRYNIRKQSDCVENLLEPKSDRGSLNHSWVEAWNVAYGEFDDMSSLSTIIKLKWRKPTSIGLCMQRFLL